MKHFIAIASLTLGMLAASVETQAHETHRDGIQVGHPWARPTPPVPPINGAAYFEITNHRDVPVVLEGATTAVTEHASIHRTRAVDGVMRMEAVEGGLDIPAGETIRFQPGGYHLMLMNLGEPLVEGGKFPVTLHFRDQDDLVLDVWVERGPESKPAMEMHQHN